jgi:hypothetical protein
VTYDEVLAGFLSLSLEDMVRFRHAIPDIIFYAARKHKQASCTHPNVHRYEERRGDRSVDVRCQLCGAIVEWR